MTLYVLSVAPVPARREQQATATHLVADVHGVQLSERVAAVFRVLQLAQEPALSMQIGDILLYSLSQHRLGIEPGIRCLTVRSSQQPCSRVVIFRGVTEMPNAHAVTAVEQLPAANFAVADIPVK